MTDDPHDGSVAVSLIFTKLEMTCKVTPQKPQRRVLKELFRMLLAFRGRATFADLARYSARREQSFRRHFERFFDWVGYNLTILRLRTYPQEPLIGGFDCSLLPKKGHHPTSKRNCAATRPSRLVTRTGDVGVSASALRPGTVPAAAHRPMASAHVSCRAGHSSSGSRGRPAGRRAITRPAAA